ncbi:MAG: hypothetical protein ABI836_06575 [Gemmatimonadota bacterium]
MRITYYLLLLASFTLAGCGKKPDAAPPAQNDTAAAATMSGMQMGMKGMEMVPAMRAHLDSLAAMTPDQMAAGLAAHEDLASRAMDAMGADMRGMNMTPDPTWTVLADSLRQDLGELPALSGSALKDRMQAHIGRMRRMMVMHEGMMKM